MFIEVFRKEANEVSPGRLFDAIAATMEGDSPRILYAALNDERWGRILEGCARDFELSEMNWLRRFIQDHRQPGDVLSLLVQRSASFLKEESPSFPNPEVSILHP
jgi:hypothetical protein